MTPRSLQFSSFTLDLDRMCQHGPAGQVEFRPKSFEVLRYLVNHSGRVIGKEELIKAVWPDVTVTDESLTRCISDIRRAIGDGSQEIIKTVPRRGYLLAVPVSATVVAPMTAPLVAETMEPNNLASLVTAGLARSTSATGRSENRRSTLRRRQRCIATWVSESCVRLTRRCQRIRT
jgi:DNA-binding winged helix-turn-helix (wHTH) protein